MENTENQEPEAQVMQFADPDKLLEKADRTSFTNGMIVSVIAHVVLIAATSISLILVWAGDWEKFGLRSPSAIKVIQKADEKAAADAARAEKAKKEAEEAAVKAEETKKAEDAKAAEKKAAEKAKAAEPVAAATKVEDGKPQQLPLDKQVEKKRPKDIDLESLDL